MCFFSALTSKPNEIEKKRNKKFVVPSSNYTISPIINAFTYPILPVVLNTQQNYITTAQWGLLPAFTNSLEFRKNTLNAKFETLHEKVSFKNYMYNRCIIFTNGFYEWQSIDANRKTKQKFFIRSAKESLFSYAGIYNYHPLLPNNIASFSIVTIPATGIMEKIHNTKKRMPLMFDNPSDEELWLNNNPFPFLNHSIELNANMV
jgi:putative SOS response-associated peptidase YedK